MKEDPEETYLSPHHRYFAERYERRRARSRFGLLFIFFGLGVSVLMILAAVMLFSLIGSIVG